MQVPHLFVQSMQKVEVRLNVRLQMRTSGAKAAQGPALHIHRVTWLTMTLPVPQGGNQKRQNCAREEGCGGGGKGGGEEERQLPPSGEKRAISNQVPSAGQFATGGGYLCD